MECVVQGNIETLHKRRASMEDANEHCPGPQSESAGKSDACEGCPNQQICANAPKGPDPDHDAIAERMATVKHKILVLSGKGGVGKSTFSAQLAFALAAMDFQVGLLDIDICGPSIPKMLGLEGEETHKSNFGWDPIYVQSNNSNLGVMSIGFMRPHPDEAVILSGQHKTMLIKQFVKDVYWDELDFLIVDTPPGTSDEQISIVQCLNATGVDGAVIVTTPQQVSLIDVRKEVNFCKKIGLNILGAVENMSSLCLPFSDFKFMRLTNHGGQIDVTDWVWDNIRRQAPEMLNLIACIEVFDSSGGGALKMCNEMGVPFLGKIPLDPQLNKAAEQGRSCFANSDCDVSAVALKKIIENLNATSGLSILASKRASMQNVEIPENANDDSPGPQQSQSVGKSDACEGFPNQRICATAAIGPNPAVDAIAERMATVKHKILVLSGKGGVGKSTFSAQLAFALAAMGLKVGLVDIDICGPSIPKMLGLEGKDIFNDNGKLLPVEVESNLRVMSIGFLLPHPDEAVIWRGPRKIALIKQFLQDVNWGELDYLIVDTPPGTSDEQITIVQCLQATGLDGAIIVTTPQQVSLTDVRKGVNFCKTCGVKVLGVVENMSSLCLPVSDFKFMLTDNGKKKDVTKWVREKAPEILNLIACCEVFDSSGGGALKMCNEMGVPFLGKVPLDPQLCKATEEGRSYFSNQDCFMSAPALKRIIERLIETVENMPY